MNAATHTTIGEIAESSSSYQAKTVRHNRDIFNLGLREPGCPTGEALTHSSKLGLRAFDYDTYRVIGDKIYRPTLNATTARNAREAWVAEKEYAIKLCRSASLGTQFNAALKALTQEMDAQARREIGSYYAQQITSAPATGETFYGHVAAVVNQMTEQAAALTALSSLSEQEEYWASMEGQIDNRLLVALKAITAEIPDVFSLDRTVCHYLESSSNLEELIAYAENAAQQAEMIAVTDQFDEGSHSWGQATLKSGSALFDAEVESIRFAMRGNRKQVTQTDAEWDWQQYLNDLANQSEGWDEAFGDTNEAQANLLQATEQFNIWRQDESTATQDHEFCGYVNDHGPEDLPAELSQLPGQLTSLYIYGQPGWEPTTMKQLNQLLEWFVEFKYPHHANPNKLINQMRWQKPKGDMPRLNNVSPLCLLHTAMETAKAQNFRLALSHQEIAYRAKETINAMFPDGLLAGDPIIMALANLLAALQQDKHVNLMRSKPCYRRFITEIRSCQDTNELRKITQAAYALSQTTKTERAGGTFHPEQLSPLETALIVTAKTVRQEQLENNLWRNTSAGFRQLVQQVRAASVGTLRGIKFAIYGDNQPSTPALKAFRQLFLSLTGQEQKELWRQIKMQKGLAA